MRGKKEKKEKRYFCDWFDWLEGDIPKKTIIVIVIIIICLCLVTGILTYIFYKQKMPEKEAEISKYSAELYDELKESITNNISEETGIDDIALRKEVYSYYISYTKGRKGQTTLTCAKVSDDGFYAEITVTLSSRYTILAEGKNYRSKEDYAKKYDEMHHDEVNSFCLALVIVWGTFGTMLLVIGMACSKSKNNKERDQKQEESCEQKQEE